MLADVLRNLSSSSELVDAFTAAIREGELAPGEPLPSIRSIAHTSGVSPGTVALAFRIMRDRGIITTAQGRRARVATQPVAQRSVELRIPDDAVNLAVVGPDPELLPPVNSVLGQQLFRPSLYDVGNVEPHLRSVMTREFAGVGVEGELTVTNGTLDALERIILARFKPGASVIVEDPCWSTSLGLLRLTGLNIVGAPVDDEGITEQGLKAALESRYISAILLTPRAQNPYGSALTPGRAAALRQILDEYPHVVVIEDDHAGLVCDVPAVTLTGGRNGYAVIRSMNKALGPDLRIAVMMSDPSTADAVQRRMLLGPGWVSHFVQRLIATMLEDPVTISAINHAREQYASRREAFLAALSRHGIHAHGRSGLNVAIPVPDETAAVSRLLIRGWAVRGGTPFRLSSGPFVRICTSTLRPDQGEQLAAAIADVLAPGRQVATP
ncbi:aminotransferase class I/II-fold pyridoxal phosphate-dependent enzyme [Georgenia sp. MJ170]|uniref:aminotransferase class I/II-fold pyridoxal phosphate-dependent enzyme n=1 Tax=Georgenia sunbinii TaxID=3117728 RepID=UPI002F266664